MLTTFLGGLAIGSLVLAKRVDRMRAPYRFFGFLEIGVGVAALGTVVLLSRYTEVHDSLLVLFQVRTWNALALVKFVEATLVILVPTLLMGMTFPVVSRLYARDMTRVGGKIGQPLKNPVTDVPADRLEHQRRQQTARLSHGGDDQGVALAAGFPRAGRAGE